VRQEGRDSSGHRHGGTLSWSPTAGPPSTGPAPVGGPSCPSSLGAGPAEPSGASWLPTQSLSRSNLLARCQIEVVAGELRAQREEAYGRFLQEP
jgi:hypothetical protein